MSEDFAVTMASQMLLTAAKVASPFLFICLAVGLVISVIQVATQIQEMTLTFIPKIIAAVLVILVLGAWMLSVLVEYSKAIFLQAANL